MKLFDTHKILIIGGLCSQEIKITDGVEAKEAADRLRFFLSDIFHVYLYGISSEIGGDENESMEELEF